MGGIGRPGVTLNRSGEENREVVLVSSFFGGRSGHAHRARHQVGPWLRQHDPAFTDRGTLLVFNDNDFWRSAAGPKRTRNPSPRPPSNILEGNPLPGTTELFRPGQDRSRIHTNTRAPNGSSRLWNGDWSRNARSEPQNR